VITKSGPAVVVALQAAVLIVAGMMIALTASRAAMLSFMAGGGCALAGTAASGMCLALMQQNTATQALRAQLIAQAVKIAVALTLLIAALDALHEWSAGLMVAGFASALLAYPFALLLVNTKKDRN
jgi:F0F1-type ATP synthase assembly protein I